MVRPKVLALLLLAVNVLSAGQGHAKPVVAASVSVGPTPSRLAVDSARNRVYVTNPAWNTVSVIDGRTNSYVATIPVGEGPMGIAIDPRPERNRVYVANKRSNTVSVITQEKGEADASDPYLTTNVTCETPPSQPGSPTVPTDTCFASPSGVGVYPDPTDPDADLLYVASEESGTVSVVDIPENRSKTEVDPLGDARPLVVDVGSRPVALAAEGGTGRVFVGNAGARTVSVIDVRSNTVVQTVGVRSAPVGVDVAAPPNCTMGLAGTSVVWTGRYAYIFGGDFFLLGADADDGNLQLDAQDAILRYDPVEGSLTTMRARLPSARSHTSAVWDGGRYAYIFGGYTAGGLAETDEILRYDAQADALRSMPSRLPWPRAATSAVWDSTRERAYIFGGDGLPSGSPFASGLGDTAQVLAYDPGASSIEEIDQLREPRSFSAAVWGGDVAYIFGGLTQADFDVFPQDVVHDDIVRFDPRGPSVDTVAHLQTSEPDFPADTYGLSAVWGGGAAFTFGARIDPLQFPTDIQRWRPDEGSAKQVSRIENDLSDRNTSAVWAPADPTIHDCAAGCAYVFGSREGGRFLQEVHRYDPASNRVTSEPCRTAYAYVVNKEDVVAMDAQQTADPVSFRTGTDPRAVGVDRVRGLAYVADAGGTVSVIQTATNAPVRDEQSRPVRIPVGREPSGVAVNEETATVYVANAGDGTISVIDGTTNTRVGTVNARSNAAGVGIVSGSAGEDRAYVANPVTDTVTVIDTSAARVLSVVRVGDQPVATAADPRTGRVYVTNVGPLPPPGVLRPPGTVSVIQGVTRAAADIPVGPNPTGIAIDPSTPRVYVANEDDGTISVINSATGTVDPVPITVGQSRPSGLAVDPQTDRLWVANRQSNTVSVIDTASTSVVTTIAVGASPSAIAIDPTARRAYVANRNSDNVTVIDTSTNAVVSTIGVGSGPLAVAVDFRSGLVYVTNSGSNTVTVIDGATNRAMTEFGVGPGSSPRGLALLPEAFLAVTNEGTNTVSLIGLEDRPPHSQLAAIGQLLVRSPGTQPEVAGSAADEGAGIGMVTVTFTPDQGPSTTTRATLRCTDDSRRFCTFSTPPPPLSGHYVVRARATDRAGNLESPGATTNLVLL